MDERIVIPTSDRTTRPEIERRPSRFRWLVGVGTAAALSLALAQGPRLEWTEGEAPQRFLNAESVVATPGAFSMLAGPDGDGGVVWTTSDGTRWLQRPLPRIGYRIVYHPTGLFVVDGRSVAVIGPDADDTPVAVAIPDPIRIGNGSDRPGLVSGLGGLVAQTVEGDIFFAAGGRKFIEVVSAEEWRGSADVTGFTSTILSVPPPRIRSTCQPVERRSPDIVPIVDAGSRLVAFVPETDPSIAWPVCEPILWVSDDGTDWRPESAESRFPFGAYITDVDWREGRYVAVGGIGLDEPAAWTSTDGAVWDVIELPGLEEGGRLVGVEQGGLGWMILADRTDHASRKGWFSTDGTCFRTVPDRVIGSSVAVNEEAVISIGRSPDPEVWVGALEGLDIDLGWCRR
ncbi:MAG TPA: hypothetical protein VIW46_11755 [Acidimicrobiia bacterium]